jgi:UDP-4-amino-4-deoxy-L-arabinose-oxoglutarate aminotransferase
VFPIWVAPEQRDAMIAGLQHHGIPTVVNYRAIHLLTYFRQTFGFRPGTFPIAEHIGDSTVSLPFYPGMPNDQVETVVEAVRAVTTDIATR